MNRRELLKSLGVAGATGTLANLAQPRIVSGQYAPGPAALGSAPSGDLQARLASAIARHKVPGASAAVFRDGALETAAAGVANVASGVEMTPDTIMHIGSITKTFNTTLVMQLVDEGRIALDEPVKRYLADFRVADPEATERITVKMLLNHTSGIDGELTREAGHDQERIVDAMTRIAAMGQIHRPGADLSYCNAAMVVAGYLAQRLTAKSWYDLVKERIFKPLEMSHAIVVPEDALLHRSSVGHFLNPSDGRLIRTSFAFLPLSYAPAGATAMMSATDLVTFGRSHVNDGHAPNGSRLLSESSARLMRTRTASYQGPGLGEFGLGWALMDNGIITHTGGGPGILSAVYAHAESKTVAAVLTNAAHGTRVINEIISPILEDVAKIRPLGSATAELVKQATDAPVDPRPYVGQYESIASVTRVIEQGNGIAFRSQSKFMVYDTTDLKETPAIRLRPIGGGRFAVGATSVMGFVNPGADGKMGHLATGGRLLKRVS